MIDKAAPMQRASCKLRRPLTTIEPPRGWPTINVREFASHRDLWVVLAKRDIQVRYRQTILGALWAILQPLLAMAIFTLVFGRYLGVSRTLPEGVTEQFASGGRAYPVFVYAGLLPWTFFAGFVTGAANSLVSNSQLMTKVYFPRLLVPLGVLGYTGLDFALASSILVVMMILVQVTPGIGVLLIPLVLLGVVTCACGIGVFLAAITVKYRDFRLLIPYLMQVWLFVTPVIYPSSVFPERWRWAVSLNPMSGFVEAFRACLFSQPLDWLSIGISSSVAVLLLSVGLLYFRRAEDFFADIV